MDRFEVRYAPIALEQLSEAKRKAEKNPDGAPGAAYDSYKKAIEDIVAAPGLSLLRKHMLRDDLAGILRVKIGRFRLFYLASSTKRQAIVLMLGYRKEGDKNDAYSVLRKQVKRGTFDAQFAELGVKKPARRAEF